MKSKLFFPSNNSGFDGQFKNLKSVDMINLRGGGDPPPTSGGDDDLIIDPFKVTVFVTTTYTVPVPVVSVPVIPKGKKPKKK